MTVANIFVPFKESTNGIPILVTSLLTKATVPINNPGTLIHTAEGELDSLWVWAAIDEPVSYLDTVYIRVLKGTNDDGFVEDSLIRLTSGEKHLIESGVIIAGSTQYRVYIDSELSTITPSVAITGYVHRRV